MARERNNQKNYHGVSQLKGLPGCATIKRTAKDGFQGVSQSKGLPGTVILKMTTREYHYQKRNVREYHKKTTTREYHTIKGVPGSIIIIMSTTEYNKVVLLGIIIIKTTAREHSNKQKSQANTKIKRTVKTNTTREYRNQNDCSGVLQAKVRTWSVKN